MVRSSNVGNPGSVVSSELSGLSVVSLGSQGSVRSQGSVESQGSKGSVEIQGVLGWMLCDN